MKDLIEDWIFMRATLIRQLELLKFEPMRTGSDRTDTTEITITGVEACIAELTKLLKEHAH